MKITVVIADDQKETRNNIKTMLGFDERIEVTGQAANGEEAIEITRSEQPDIILLDINMPVLDGLKAAEEINLTHPDTAIIMMSVQGEQEYLKKSMYAGAKEYIVKPFSSENLIDTIIQVYEQEEKRKLYQDSHQQENKLKDDDPSQIITVFSTKGGVGKTTLAVNLAISIAKNSKKKVAVLDLDLQFGDIALMLNIQPKKTIYNLIEDIHSLNSEIIEDYLITHFSGIRVLCAPLKPEYADYINVNHIEKIIEILKERYSYVIMDTTQVFSDIILSTLDISDTVLFVSTMDLPTIKNVKLGLDVMESLNYPKEKIKLVLNKASELYGVKFNDIEEALQMEICTQIPEDNYTVTTYANKGFPFILARSEKKISKTIQTLADQLLGKEIQPRKRFGFF
jgi:pilus assembly protein CpaE